MPVVTAVLSLTSAKDAFAGDFSPSRFGAQLLLRDWKRAFLRSVALALLTHPGVLGYSPATSRLAGVGASVIFRTGMKSDL